MPMLGIDGLASGLDTTSLINQLMQVEAMPQTLLKQKQSSAESLVSGLQGLNTRLASLAETAEKSAKADSWSAFKAASTADTVAVSATSSAQAGTLTFSVDQVAQNQVSLSGSTTADGAEMFSTYPPTVTISKADGSTVTVQPTSGSLSDVARAINEAADAGVRASVVRVSGGTDGSEPQYRIQFTGVSTGTEGGFEVYEGTADDVAAETAPRLDGTVVRAGSDAQITLWKGAGEGVEQTFTQSSNTFTGLMTGVDVTVSAQSTEPVTITVERDEEALTKLASNLVGSLGVVLSEISSRTATSTKTNPDGSTSVTGGLFSGDSTVRSIRDQLSSAMSMPVDGRSPSEVGITIERDGTFTFDQEKFTAAMAADPAATQSMVTQLAERVGAAATGFSDKYDGSLTRKIESQQGQVRDMGTQIEDWDRRLELRRAGLERTYSALEVTLSNLQSQSSWLAGQLGSLPSASSGP